MKTRKKTSGVLSIEDDRPASNRRIIAEVRRVEKDYKKQLKEEGHYDTNAGFPRRTWKSGGENRPRSGWGVKDLRAVGVKTAAHTAATAYPFVAGPSLGPHGVLIGRDLNGGGPFCFDPWEAYKRKIISGMSMLLFGTVGMGKSSLVKSFALRLVLAGRKLAVASDLKGEWTPIVQTVGGVVIQIGPGAGNRMNPLDEGARPELDQRGNPMTDEQWAMVVRTRRLTIMETLLKILTGQEELSAAEHAALEEGIDGGVSRAREEDRPAIIPDVIEALREVMEATRGMVSEAAELLALSLRRVTTGDLAGMFDGPSTVNFSADAPAVSIDTSAMRGASQVARRMVSACCGAWLEAMITNSSSGQRLVVYEEGWDSIQSVADLERMVQQWKLSRAYGIFNILILHKVSDLNMAGDVGSKMAAMAKSLLADADVKVIYRQDAAALRVTMDELELNERERSLLRTLPKGEGLWRVNQATFEIANELTEAEIPLLDTDERMDGGDPDDAEDEAVELDEDGYPIREWWHAEAAVA